MPLLTEGYLGGANCEYGLNGFWAILDSTS